MTHKSPRIREMVAGLEGKGWDPRYLGYFQCFNAAQYYEAHDVLEDLWLEKRGTELDLFYKALIQFAGAFVHLQKGRVSPACALLKLSSGYLGRFPEAFEGLDLSRVLQLASAWLQVLQHPVEPGAEPLSPPLLEMPQSR